MKKAFSLIELIISIAIIALFAGLTIPQYNTYNNQLKLKKELKNASSVFELAKKKALSSDLFNVGCTNFEGYRVEIGANSYRLLFLCNGTQTQVQNYVLDANISITAGTGNFDFGPVGAATIVPASPIIFRSIILNECVNMLISPIGIVTPDETLFGC